MRSAPTRHDIARRSRGCSEPDKEKVGSEWPFLRSEKATLTPLFLFLFRSVAQFHYLAGQLQLLQPFMGLFLAAVLLHEPIAPAMVAACAVVVLCVAGARRATRPAPAEAALTP